MYLLRKIGFLGLFVIHSSLGFSQSKDPPKKLPQEVKAPQAPNQQTPEVAVTPEELKGIQSQLNTKEYLVVDFTQNVFKNLRKKNLVSTGVAYFMKPDHFRWQLQTPKREEWLYDGKMLSNFDPTKNEAMRYNAQAAKGKELRQLVDMVLNFDTLMNNYKLNRAVKRDAIVTLELQPSKTEDILTAELEIDLSQNFIRSVKLNFRSENNTYFQFSNPRREKIEPKILALPSQVKVIDAL